MKKEFGYVTDREGNAVAGAEIYIRKQSDSSLLTLYSDNGVTTTANPLTTDNDGEWSAYFADNVVKIQTFVDGVQQQEVNNHQHYDLSVITAFAWTILDDTDAGTVRATIAAAGTGVANTFSALQTLSAGANLTPAAAPATNAVGYLGSPQMSDQDDYTLVMADSGKHYYHVSASTHTVTIPANASVAYPIGTILTFINENGGGDLTIAITSDTLRWGGSTGSRTLGANGTASAVKVTSTVWRLTGDGIS